MQIWYFTPAGTAPSSLSRAKTAWLRIASSA